VSADTIVPGAGNPQAFNRFSYSLSNPLKYIDPTGHASTPSCAGKPDCNVNDAEGNDFTNAIATFCAAYGCWGANVSWMKVDLKFLKNLLGADYGVVSLPYHLNANSLSANDLFPWEGVANVTYNEHRQLHPDFNQNPRDKEYFRQRFIGDAAGIMQTMINRGESRGRTPPNQEALAGGQYAPPRQGPANERAYQQFYALAFVVVALDVNVAQPYKFFSHQDLNDVRGKDPTGDINGRGVGGRTTDTAAFGPTAGRKIYYVPPIPMYP
jgi:hypothetical protein